MFFLKVMEVKNSLFTSKSDDSSTSPFAVVARDWCDKEGLCKSGGCNRDGNASLDVQF
jgi:hypothetical protein